MPLSVEEYQRGQLFSTAEASKNETGGNEGVQVSAGEAPPAHLCPQVITQEPFESSTVRPGHQLSGMYTYKIYELRSKLPWVFRKVGGAPWSPGRGLW